MFVSFIIPVYNAEKYLRECIESLLNQDIPKSEYEIICVNDGSTDQSLQILEEYESDITIINQENGGVCRARNAGLEVAQGRYIWFVDADDFIQDNILGRVKSLIEEKDCDMLTIGLYYFENRLTDSEMRNKQDRSLKVNRYGFDANVYTQLIKRQFLKQNNCKFHYPQLAYGEDGLFVYEVKRNHPKRDYLIEPVYFYRGNSSSAMHQSSKEATRKKIHSGRMVVLKYYEYYLKDRNSDVADLLMANLWISLYQIAALQRREAKNELVEWKENNIWPLKRVPECTLKKSYATDRTDWVGKLFDFLYMHSNTILGYKLLRIWHKIYAIKKTEIE